MENTIKNIELSTKSIRNFNAEKYIAAKCDKINKFFYTHDLDAAVVGISGGIDSAVTIALLNRAASIEGSPIKRIEGIIMPIHGKGTSGQHDATNNGLKVMQMFHESKITGHRLFDLTAAFDSYVQWMTPNINDAWAMGQLASIVRTPALYYSAALLQSMHFKSIVVGTTNRDEGSYIGFFGKASDAMVDLQPIADIHKSEVYAIAELLGVPEQIINAKPKGDVWDGKNDEEMIGAPYWFLEMYLIFKDEFSAVQRNDAYLKLNNEEQEIFRKYALAIENLHKKNAHKYDVGCPSHFIDVMPRKILGGWK